LTYLSCEVGGPYSKKYNITWHSRADLHPRRGPHWTHVLEDATVALERTQRCFEDIESDCMLDYDLPRKKGMLAGGIMKHCHEAVDRLLQSQMPCIFKIGYTHDASWRFNNKMYGYKFESAKWSKLVVLYAAAEPISAAFVEAALIQRHKGLLNAYISSLNSNQLKTPIK